MVEEYKRINTPEDLMAFMDKYVKYGVRDNDGSIYEFGKGKFHDACKKSWRSKSAFDVMKLGYGHCFDQTEIEREWFEKNKYEYKTFFVIVELEYENNYPCHAYLVYKDKKNNLWNWFEHADLINKGIHKFNDFNEALEYQKRRMILFNRICGLDMDDDIIAKMHIYEYAKPPVGCSQQEFVDYIVANGKDMVLRKKK